MSFGKLDLPRILVILGVLLGLLAHFLSFTDSNWSPVATPLWPKSPHPTTRSTSCTILSHDLEGAEDLTFKDGWAYSGLRNGSLVKFKTEPSFSHLTLLGETGGRPLGLRFDSEGTLWIADAFKGLLSWTPKGGFKEEVPSVDGIAINFADHVAISKDGKDIYFSDASTKNDLHHFHNDLWEGRPWGRIVHYHVPTKQVRVVAKDLYFANGIDLSEDESSLIIAETPRARLISLSLRGPKAGQVEPLVGTGGFVDNLTPAASGDYTWAAFAAKRTGVLETVIGSTLLRRLMRKLPPPPSPPYCECARIHKKTGEIAELRHMEGVAACTVCAPHNGHLLTGHFELKMVASCKL